MNPETMKWKLVRLERPSTRSFLTVALPEPMFTDKAEGWVEVNYPGWSIIALSPGHAS
jgi:hypothetical protein